MRGRRSENRPVQKALKRRSGNGSRARIGNFTLDGGTVADSAEAPGSLGAYRFRLRAGTVEAALADVVVPASQNPAPHSNLFKEGEGTTLGRHLYLGEGSVFHATLGAASARTPALVATNSAARIVLDGATLDFSLADGGAVSLYNGVTLVDNRGTLPVEGAFAGLPEGEPVKLPSGRAIYHVLRRRWQRCRPRQLPQRDGHPLPLARRVHCRFRRGAHGRPVRTGGAIALPQ